MGLREALFTSMLRSLCSVVERCRVITCRWSGRELRAQRSLCHDERGLRRRRAL